MKKFITLGLVMTILLSGLKLFAQSELPENLQAPLKDSHATILYGNDIIIDNQATQNQRQACLSVAFNGWLYAAYLVTEGTDHSWKIYRSTDDGETWQLLKNVSLSLDWYNPAIDIVVCGNAEADLRVFVSRIAQNDVSNSTELIISSVDGNTGATIATLHDDFVTTGDKFMDVAIASDYRFPAYNASPYSVAIVYSRTNPSADSVIYLASSDGGATLGIRQVVQATGNYCHKVSLAYGRCATNYNGRYFAAWEEGSSTFITGQIWTARNDYSIDLDFTTPVRVEDLLANTATFARNPSISCQFNDIDNSAGGLTEVIVFDRAYDGDLNSFDVVGVYNTQPITTAAFSIFGVNASYLQNDMQPDLNYDPGNNNFLLTYYKKTEERLPYMIQYMDMPDPYNWGIITNFYNEETNINDPYPKVEINPVIVQVAHVWDAERSGGNGIAMFDAEYSTVGIDQVQQDPIQLEVYPNPARESVSFAYTPTSREQVTITIYNAYGQAVKTITANRISIDRMIQSVNISELPTGYYSYRLRCGTATAEGKFAVTK